MLSMAEGPCDAALMAATKRAIARAGKRLPADRRFGDLLEIRGSLEMNAEALNELRNSIDAFASRGLSPSPPSSSCGLASPALNACRR